VEVVYKSMTSKHLMVPKPGKIEKTTGAGDTFTGAFCSMLLYGKQ
jgi:sugar/nucleoside kinase (ribokinase family)